MVSNDIFTFLRAPNKIISGPNAAQGTGKEASLLGCQKVLLVSDEGIKKAGLLQSIIASLDEASIKYVLYTDVQTNPVIDLVEKGLAIYREQGCDGLVAVGGGSPIDVAKAIGVLVNNPGRIQDYEGVGKARNPMPPLIAIPTTCGTGSEATPLTVIIDPARKHKMVVHGPTLTPAVAIIDPVLMYNLPAHLVAATGMDALTHAIESFTNTKTNPFSDALNIHAIRMIGKNLRLAVANGDHEAIYQMAMASTIAGFANASTRLGLVHAMANVVGGHTNVHHGIANAILLPYVMDFNVIGAMERFAEIAEALGEDISGLPLREAAQLAVDAVWSLSEDIGIPETLAEVGVTADILPALVKDTVNSPLLQINARRATPADVKELFEIASDLA